MKKIVVLPASGIGQRMCESIPKQYIKLANNKTILDNTISSLLKDDFFDLIIIALSHNDVFWQHSCYFNHDKIHVCKGGATRFLSVYNALLLVQKLADIGDVIFVHDAVRPFVNKNDFQALLDSVLLDAQPVILALQATDTIKLKENDRLKTIDRNKIFLAQTPQVARFDLFMQSFVNILDKNLENEITDEASAFERFGFKVNIVQGKKINIKITMPEDLELANFILTKKN